MTDKVFNISVLAGDYIGPEIMRAALKVLAAVSEKNDFHYQLQELPFGGAAIDQCGDPLPEQTLKSCQQSDAVLLAAIGGPKWDAAVKRPEAGLLAIRKALNLFVNIRPTLISPAATQYSPLKNAQAVDFLIVRELTGGIYFGRPREFSHQEALDTMRYRADEITRVVQVAFAMAAKRKKKVTLVDKANVLATSKLWRQLTAEIAKQHPDITCDYSYVDAAAMKIIAAPESFDVIVTENLFGDILSDEAAQITGSLGTIPSMSQGGQGPILYEPIHGSAPDIAGQGIANPLSMINSVAMMLEHSFNRRDLADKIKRAVDHSIANKMVTPDLGGDQTTETVTAAIIKDIQESEQENVTDNV